MLVIAENLYDCFYRLTKKNSYEAGPYAEQYRQYPEEQRRALEEVMDEWYWNRQLISFYEEEVPRVQEFCRDTDQSTREVLDSGLDMSGVSSLWVSISNQGVRIPEGAPYDYAGEVRALNLLFRDIAKQNKSIEASFTSDEKEYIYFDGHDYFAGYSTDSEEIDTRVKTKAVDIFVEQTVIQMEMAMRPFAPLFAQMYRDNAFEDIDDTDVAWESGFNTFERNLKREAQRRLSIALQTTQER